MMSGCHNPELNRIDALERKTDAMQHQLWALENFVSHLLIHKPECLKSSKEKSDDVINALCQQMATIDRKLNGILDNLRSN